MAGALTWLTSDNSSATQNLKAISDAVSKLDKDNFDIDFKYMPNRTSWGAFPIFKNRDNCDSLN